MRLLSLFYLMATFSYPMWTGFQRNKFGILDDNPTNVDYFVTLIVMYSSPFLLLSMELSMWGLPLFIYGLYRVSSDSLGPLIAIMISFIVSKLIPFLISCVREKLQNIRQSDVNFIILNISVVLSAMLFVFFSVYAMQFDEFSIILTIAYCLFALNVFFMISLLLLVVNVDRNVDTKCNINKLFREILFIPVDLCINFRKTSQKFLFLLFGNHGHFYYLCTEGKVEEIEEIIQYVVYPWNIALSYACSEGHVKVAKIMLSKGAKYYNDGLISACRGGHLEAAKLMIENGASNLNCSLTDLIVGLYFKKETIQKSMGPNWNYDVYSDGIRNYLEIAKLLVFRGATNVGKCLTYKYNKKEIIYLLENGMDLEQLKEMKDFNDMMREMKKYKKVCRRAMLRNYLAEVVITLIGEYVVL